MKRLGFLFLGVLIMYTKEQLRRLLIPLMFEQVLTALMGSVDTIMVTNIGSAAISAVSLVDSLNILIINIFAAMATGGAIICAQYLGSNQKDKANQALKQLIFSVTLISLIITIPCILFRRPLLSLIFGSVEKNVMLVPRVVPSKQISTGESSNSKQLTLRI